MKKRIVSILLVLSVLVCLAAVNQPFAATAEEKKFVVDGVLDPWYITGEDDYGVYYYTVIDAYEKPSGTAPFDEYSVRIEADIWTAYDDDYIYFYVKVWDDNLIPHDNELYPGLVGIGTGEVDSIEAWIDPDPNSVDLDDPARYDDRGNYKEGPVYSARSEVENDCNFRLGGFDYSEYTEKEGLLLGQFFIDDMKNRVRDENDVVRKWLKPNYGGLTLGEYWSDPSNLVPFRFENEPRETRSMETVSSGYGVEFRVPRVKTDNAGYYRFNIAVNDSSLDLNNLKSHCTLALGGAWWLNWNNAVTVLYQDVNPFFGEGSTDDGSGGSSEVPPVVPTRLPGDVNGDKKVNASDALFALKASVGKIVLSDVEFKAADLDGNQKINASDALAILKISVGK